MRSILAEFVGKKFYNKANDGFRDSEPWILLGMEHGPLLLCRACSFGDAYEEFLDRFGTEVPSDEKEFCAEFGIPSCQTIESACEMLMNDGEIRFVDGGKVVHAEHYEWAETFQTKGELKAYLRDANRNRLAEGF